MAKTLYQMKKLKKEATTPSTTSLKELLNSDNPKELRALFGFTKETPIEKILLKFNLFGRKYYPKFYTSEDAEFHRLIDEYNCKCYTGNITSFLDIVFRGGSKTTRTKLFVAFCILNDEEHYRRYIKILSRDNTNSTQFVTDIYNLLIQPQVSALYPETFAKTITKREETMSSFTTATGIKITAGTVGQSQRGAIQDEARPDLIIFDDFEDRSTLRSAVVSKAIWDNMEEAKNGLARGGTCIYLCNYVSEQGNVHRLVEKVEHKLIIPIIADGQPTWSRYSLTEIERLRREVDDFEGEYLCKPNASKEVYFDREILEAMPTLQPKKEIAGFKIFKEYNPSHRYGAGHDIAGGVGLDSSTSVFIDFDQVPAQVVATFASNTIDPEAFGDEMYNEGCMYGLPIQAPENNKFEQAILKAKQLGCNLYKTGGSQIKVGHKPALKYGWSTNSLTKSKMLSGLKQAIESGHLELNDENLKREAMSYTRNDLIDNDPDIRLTTRHFDLLTACCIAWQMKDHADHKIKDTGWARMQSSMKKDINPAL